MSILGTLDCWNHDVVVVLLYCPIVGAATSGRQHGHRSDPQAWAVSESDHSTMPSSSAHVAIVAVRSLLLFSVAWLPED